MQFINLNFCLFIVHALLLLLFFELHDRTALLIYNLNFNLHNIRIKEQIPLKFLVKFTEISASSTLKFKLARNQS